MAVKASQVGTFQGYHPNMKTDDDDDHEGTLCKACGDNYANDEFWICCDICERWFHGRYVKITPAKAGYMKHYKCPTCTAIGARIQV
ncbi:hypothetical protein R6Q59_033181 [Mikania micrantha]